MANYYNTGSPNQISGTQLAMLRLQAQQNENEAKRQLPLQIMQGIGMVAGAYNDYRKTNIAEKTAEGDIAYKKDVQALAREESAANKPMKAALLEQQKIKTERETLDFLEDEARMAAKQELIDKLRRKEPVTQEDIMMYQVIMADGSNAQMMGNMGSKAETSGLFGGDKGSRKPYIGTQTTFRVKRANIGNIVQQYPGAVIEIVEE